MDNSKKLYLGGLGLMAIIWLFTGLTARDPLWAGKAITYSMFVLLAVALADFVIRKNTEEE